MKRKSSFSGLKMPLRPPRRPQAGWRCPKLAVLLAATLCALSGSARAHSLPVTWDKQIEVAQGKAFRGPWMMNESVWRFVDDPMVAITDEGNVGVAWADHSRKDLFIQVFGPDGKGRFTEPVNISRSPRIFSWLPRVIMTSGDPEEVYVLWQEIIFSGGTHGGEILFAMSADDR